jgi:hypothetical protein
MTRELEKTFYTKGIFDVRVREKEREKERERKREIKKR